VSRYLRSEDKSAEGCSHQGAQPTEKGGSHVLLRPQVQDFFGDQIVADIGRAYAVTFPLPQLPRAKPACLDRARSTSSRWAPHAGRLLTA